MQNISSNFKKYYFKQIDKLFWFKKPKTILTKKNDNNYNWFPDGKINVYYNCITSNINKNPLKTALITINKKNKIDKYNFKKIDELVNLLGLYLKKISKKKNLKIMIHSSASLESAIMMLVCAKLGYHFSVIFEELESVGIENRIKIFKPDIFFTRLKKKNFVQNTGFELHKKITKFIFREDFKKAIKVKNKKLQVCKVVSSANSLFTLFTSGSTGAPKGITHSSGGYLLHAKMTCEKQFGMSANSIVLTASDAGWINGHTYALFGPLSLGATSILIEKPISLIDINLFKKILDLKTTIVYLPVTLIRLIKSFNKNFNIDKRYIKTIGSMGEPLAPSVSEWYAKKFLNKNRAVVNTYFQTETGGIICSPKYNQNTNQIPHGSVGRVMSKYIKISSLASKKLNEIKILSPWPGMMKNVMNGKKEWNKYWDGNNNFRLFDLASVKKKNVFIHGRNDDVINIRGHRIGSEEIESVLLRIKEIKECCVISIKDELEGFKTCIFIVSEKNLTTDIEKVIISQFGSYALPKKIFYVNQLPKTRSGKILRRLLRNIVENPNLKNYGDVSTILNFDCLKNIKKIVKINE
ncbi:AMP-binding protein [Candidatus Pelagibacter sp.]|nr:AMP-binding protein [Candidatus Pelagibacter sp.]